LSMLRRRYCAVWTPSFCNWRKTIIAMCSALGISCWRCVRGEFQGDDSTGSSIRPGQGQPPWRDGSARCVESLPDPPSLPPTASGSTAESVSCLTQGIKVITLTRTELVNLRIKKKYITYNAILVSHKVESVSCLTQGNHSHTHWIRKPKYYFLKIRYDAISVSHTELIL
jgi:hypothetical protein